MDNDDSLNFIPVFQKVIKDNEVSKERDVISYVFIPKVNHSPMRNVYRHTSQAEYMRIIEDGENCEK